MFREMRKIGVALSEKEAEQMLEAQKYGTLALIGDEGYPYSVPVNYVYHDRKIYFHGAAVGHKLEAIKKNPKVSFSVVGKDQIVPEAFNTLYSSTIVFGKAKVLTDDAEKRNGLELILKKFSPDHFEGGLKYIKTEWENVCVYEIEVEHMTGKAGD